MKKKAYISPETEVVNVKIENLMNMTISGEGISGGGEDTSDPNDPSYEPPRSRRRNVWDEEEEDW